MKTSRLHPPLAVGTATLALGGCNAHTARQPGAAARAGSAKQASASPDEAAAFGADPHACTVVTEQEATTALGKDPGAGQGAFAGGVGNCVHGARSTTAAGRV